MGFLVITNIRTKNCKTDEGVHFNLNTVTAPIMDAASNQVLFFGHGPRPIFKRGLKSKNIFSDVCT